MVSGALVAGTVVSVVSGPLVAGTVVLVAGVVSVNGQ